MVPQRRKFRIERDQRRSTDQSIHWVCFHTRTTERTFFTMAQEAFQKALGALADENYRKGLESDPNKLTKDFNLSPSEQVILMAVGEACGAMPDVSGYAASSGGVVIACCCCCP
jgi:hypothetical protein